MYYRRFRQYYIIFSKGVILSANTFVIILLVMHLFYTDGILVYFNAFNEHILELIIFLLAYPYVLYNTFKIEKN